MDLERAWADACAGKPACVEVSGSAGAFAASLGDRAIVARAERHAVRVPFLVAGQVLAWCLERESAVSGEERDAFEYLRTGGATLARRTDSSGTLPEHRRNVAFRFLNGRLLREEAPLCVAIEGWQWIDEASRAWVDSLRAGLVTGRNVLLVLATLPEEADEVRVPDFEPGSAEAARDAARALVEAAERSLACAAPKTAMAQIMEASGLFAQLGEDDAAWQARLLDARAAAHAAGGSLTAAILQSQLRLAVPSPPEDLCRAYDRHVGYLVKKGEPGQAFTTCRDALAKIPPGTPGRTKLLARRAQSLLLAGRHQDALADCAECLADLDPARDPQLAGFVYFLWGGVEIRRLDLVKARAALESALEHFRTSGDLYNETITLSDLGTAHVRLGEADPAAACFAEGIALAERIGDRRLHAMLFNNQGMLVCQQGDLAAARDCFAQALAIHRDMDDQRSMGIALLNLGEVCLDLGEQGEADRYLGEALRVNEKIGAWDVMGETYRQIARLEAERGDKLAELDAIKQATQIAETTGQLELQGVMLRLLAGLQAALGNLGEALATAEESIATLEGIDAPLELGRSYAELARLLGAHGEPDRAGAARTEAEALFVRTGARHDLDQLRHLVQGEHP